MDVIGLLFFAPVALLLFLLAFLLGAKLAALSYRLFGWPPPPQRHTPFSRPNHRGKPDDTP